MKAQTLRDYLSVHTWVGIVSGLLLFIAFYAGAFSMLEPEITRWASAPAERPAASADADAAMQQFFAEHPDVQGRVSLRLAGPDHATPLIKLVDKARKESWFELGQDGRMQSLSRTKEEDSSGNFVDYLHRKGGLPVPLDWAEPVIGVVSLLYALALVSGVVVLLPSLVKDLLYVRLGANLKRMWLDIHNLLGITSLPFHIAIALSAAVFGLHDAIYSVQDHFIYKDGLRATVARSSAPKPPAVLDPGQWLKPSDVVSRLQAQAPQFTPRVIDYVGLGGKQPVLFVAGLDDQHFKRGALYGYAFVDPATGRIFDSTHVPGQQGSALSGALSVFFSLHFGSFGGDPVRVLYVLLGLSGALLFYTGNLLWIETRTKRLRQRSPHAAVFERPRHVRALSALTVGVCLGCAAALPATLVAARWLSPWVGDMDVVHQGVFYALFAGCMAWAGLWGTARVAAPLLWFTAACNALVPITALLFAAGLGGAKPRPHEGGFWLLELLCLLLAVFFAVLAYRRRYPRLAATAAPTPAAHPGAAAASMQASTASALRADTQTLSTSHSLDH